MEKIHLVGNVWKGKNRAWSTSFVSSARIENGDEKEINDDCKPL
jgi:hypothetical protein